tara:strand:- start:11 stop:211 length:201 start_codon:yes stop_codon:yes gene_type:complete
MSKGKGYDKFYEFLGEMFNKEKLYQLQMLENGEINSEEFGSDKEIFDNMIDWFVEDVRNLSFEDIN